MSNVQNMKLNYVEQPVQIGYKIQPQNSKKLIKKSDKLQVLKSGTKNTENSTWEKINTETLTHFGT